MGSMSIWHWLIVLLIVVLLFGKGRIADMMGDVAKGIKNFKKGLSDEQTPQATPDAGRIADAGTIDVKAEAKSDVKS
jgi:sec-independent protein translocase protein TatA